MAKPKIIIQIVQPKQSSKLQTIDKIDCRCKFHQCSMSSFYARRLKKNKKTVKLSIFFAVLGSASAKAACRTFIKLITGQCTSHIYHKSDGTCACTFILERGLTWQQVSFLIIIIYEHCIQKARLL